MPHVGPDRVHDLVFGKIDLWIQVGNAELAASPATGRHLDHAEGRSCIGKQNCVTLHRMFYFDAARQIFSRDRFSKQVESLGRLTASFDYAIDAQLFVSVGLNDLPAAGTPNDDFEITAVRAALDLCKQIPCVM